MSLSNQLFNVTAVSGVQWAEWALLDKCIAHLQELIVKHPEIQDFLFGPWNNARPFFEKMLNNSKTEKDLIVRIRSFITALDSVGSATVLKGGTRGNEGVIFITSVVLLVLALSEMSHIQLLSVGAVAGGVAAIDYSKGFDQMFGQPPSVLEGGMMVNRRRFGRSSSPGPRSTRTLSMRSSEADPDANSSTVNAFAVAVVCMFIVYILYGSGMIGSQRGIDGGKKTKRNKRKSKGKRSTRKSGGRRRTLRKKQRLNRKKVIRGGGEGDEDEGKSDNRTLWEIMTMVDPLVANKRREDEAVAAAAEEAAAATAAATAEAEEELNDLRAKERDGNYTGPPLPLL